MECRVCGAEISGQAKFCPSCGSKTSAEQDEMEIIDAAISEAEEVFDAEMAQVEEMSDESGDESEYGEDEEEDYAGPSGTRKSAGQRFREIRDVVKQKKDSAVEFGKKVGDTSVKAYQKGKEVHADVTQKVGVAVDKTKEVSGEVAVQAKKVGKGVRVAVKKTKETIDELGQVGVIITQRALDVVRASLKAVEIVDNYLEQKDSQYEVGNFITGVGIPPYLEIEFTKRSDDITNEEKKIIRMLRASDFSHKTMEEVGELLKRGKIKEHSENSES